MKLFISELVRQRRKGRRSGGDSEQGHLRESLLWGAAEKGSLEANMQLRRTGGRAHFEQGGTAACLRAADSNQAEMLPEREGQSLAR